MRKREGAWETPSLEWIHRVRRERQAALAGRSPKPLPRREAERLAARFGLKLARPAPANR